MDAIECIKTRRSVRKFENKPVSKEILEELVACANQAPSAMALYPWQFVVVTDKQRLRRIAEAATYGSFIKEAAACIVVCGDKSNRNTVIDCSAATQNILLAAKALGLGTCWVQGWKASYNEIIAKVINLPEELEVVSLVPIGYPAQSPNPGKKLIKSIMNWETF
jgi:nitroreductase